MKKNEIYYDLRSDNLVLITGRLTSTAFFGKVGMGPFTRLIWPDTTRFIKIGEL
jgi:hypothetical protein